MTIFESLMNKANSCLKAAAETLDMKVEQEWRRKGIAFVEQAMDLDIDSAEKEDNLLHCNKLTEFNINHHGHFCGTYRWNMEMYDFVGNHRRMSWGWEVTPTIVNVPQTWDQARVELLRESLESAIRAEINALNSGRADPVITRWM